MLFVDYADRPGTATPTDLFDQPRTEGDAVDERGVVRAHEPQRHVRCIQWFRMPQVVHEYLSRADNTFAAQRQLIADAVTAANPTVEFGGYQLIYVVSPSGSDRLSRPAFNRAAVPRSQRGRQHVHPWSDARERLLRSERGLPADVHGSNVLIHETGHTFGLPDLYDYDRTDVPVQHVRRQLGRDGRRRPRSRVRRMAAAPARMDRSTAARVRGRAGDAGRAALTDRDERWDEGGDRARPRRATTRSPRTARQPRRMRLLCDTGVLVYTVDATIGSGHGSIRVRPAAPDDGLTSLIRCGPFYNAAFGWATPAWPAGGVSLRVMCSPGRRPGRARLRTGSRSTPGRARCVARSRR